MATHRGDPDSFLDALAQELAADDTVPRWENASDLARLHMQEHARRVAGGFNLHTSRGALRLTGEGVHGHTVDMTNAGEFLTRWQALVTSTGAAAEGNRSIRRLPEEITRKTSLALSASPSPGSLILEFVANVDEAAERYPGGEPELFDEERVPLVERAVDTAFDVLDMTMDADPGDLVDRLADLGPRVASKALDLAELASDANLDLDLTWEVPGRARRRNRSSAAQLAQFAAVLRAGKLATEPLIATGVLRTVSDRKKIDLEVDHDVTGTGAQILAIERGDVDFSSYRIGDIVEVSLTMRLTSRPGGAEGRQYVAEGVRPIGD